MGQVIINCAGDSLTNLIRHRLQQLARCAINETASVLAIPCPGCSVARLQSMPLCDQCLGAVNDLPQLLDAIFVDQDPVSRLVRLAKREATYGITATLCSVSEARVRARIHQVGPDVITWIPADRWRTIQRSGWSLPLRFSQFVSKATGVPCAPLLERSERAITMRGHTRQERKAQARGIFRPRLQFGQFIEPSAGTVAPGKVLVVDDVRTTGATLETAVTVLESAGWQAEALAIVGRR